MAFVHIFLFFVFIAVCLVIFAVVKSVFGVEPHELIGGGMVALFGLALWGLNSSGGSK